MASRLLSLFGTPSLDEGGASTPIALPFERRSQLVAVLALRRAWVPRAEIAALLWPEQPDKLAFTNLRKTLFRLQDVPWGAALEVQGTRALRYDAATDVHDFERALRSKRLDDAIALVRGPLLAGFDDDANEPWTAWLRFERQRLQSAWRAAVLEHLASATLDDAAALALSARLLEADPLDEAALRVHLARLGAAGQAARARQVYREFARRLHDELGIEPGAELQALHDGLAHEASAPRDRPAVAAPAAADSAESGFIGRVAERRRLGEWLTQGKTRLVCLTGPGGIGKTRLAQRVMQDVAPQFADGAVFVRLEDVGTEDDLWTRVAREADIALHGREAALQQLCEALQERPRLLVLDNFEQLVEAAPALETLLAACPRLTLLVTSRVRLALPSEQLLPLEGLPCPAEEDVDQVEGFDAVRLFVAAAQRVEPGLLPGSEAAALVEICRLVDGLPLALELAASWTRVLSCEAIAAELRAGTELLRDSGSGHSARHASIEQVFEQSWQRLAPTEAEALARLSVFQGGFTVEAVRAVARTPLPVLGSLVDKSLLRKDGSRLSLHPLVQQLAAARLGQAAAQVRAAHAAYFHQLLVQLRVGCERGERSALQTVDHEFDNCKLAWRWALAEGDAGSLRRMNAALQDFVHQRARYQEGLALVHEALEAARARGDATLHALMQAWAAFHEFRLGRHEQAGVDATAALEASRRTRDAETRLVALKTLGSRAWATGEFEAARRWMQQAVEQAEAGGFEHERAPLLENTALVEKYLGNYDEALRLSLEAQAQYRRNGDVARLAMCMSNLGSFYMFIHDTGAAATHLQQALQLSEEHGLVTVRAFTLANLVELGLKTGDHDAARRHAERALEVCRGTGLRSLSGWLTVQLARLAAQRHELDAARTLLAEATQLALELNVRTVQAAALLAFAELLEAQGDGVAGRRVLAFAVAQPALSAPDRDELRVEWARRVAPDSAPDNAADPWPGLTLDALLQRIVDEAPRGHDALRSALGAATAAPIR